MNANPQQDIKLKESSIKIQKYFPKYIYVTIRSKYLITVQLYRHGIALFQMQ